MIQTKKAVLFGLFLISAISLTGCGGGGSGNLVVNPALVVSSVSVLGGDGQTAVAGTALPNPINVLIKNSDGQPIANQPVNFKARAGSGSVLAGVVTSDANGQARTIWTLGPIAGVQTVEVSAVNSSGLAVVFAAFTANATAGTPQAISIVSGNNQTVVQNLLVAQPLSVIVTDANANPVPNLAVTFQASSGSGYINPQTISKNQSQQNVLNNTVTDSNGKAAWSGYFYTAGQQQTDVSVATLAAVKFTTSVATSSHTYDGAWSCGIDVSNFEIVNGSTTYNFALYNPANVTFNESTRTLTGGYSLMGVGYIRTYAGLLTVDSSQLGSGSGTTTQTYPTSSVTNWTCNRY